MAAINRFWPVIGVELKPRPLFSVKIPLGWWKSENFHLQLLSTSKGWHFHYLLVVVDRTPAGWRYQRQRKAAPLTYWEDHYGRA